MRHRPQLSDRRAMVELQLRARGIDDERVLAAMERVPRELFVPPAVRLHAYEDAALPIGSDQTISQPYMVARICAELRLRGHEKVLDVGTGSGYQAAVLAELAREVHSIERIPELAAAARDALAEAGYGGRVHVVEGDGSLGLPGEAPFDAINVAAACGREALGALEAQLAPGGRLVAPVEDGEQRLVVARRTDAGVALTELERVRFVPLVSSRG